MAVAVAEVDARRKLKMGHELLLSRVYASTLWCFRHHRRAWRALVRSAEIDAGNVNVETDGGDVTLTGTVRSWAERDEAEAAAWRGGATLVTNNIRIAPLKRF